jgi:hypothetical protein
MNRQLLLITISLVVFVSCCAQPVKPKWHLTWSDEFNYKGLPDSSKWNYDIGSHSGWGNNELEYYTYKKLQNARVEKETIIAKRKS